MQRSHYLLPWHFQEYSTQLSPPHLTTRKLELIEAPSPENQHDPQQSKPKTQRILQLRSKALRSGSPGGARAGTAGEDRSRPGHACERDGGGEGGGSDRGLHRTLTPDQPPLLPPPPPPRRAAGEISGCRTAPKRSSCKARAACRIREP